MDDSRGSLVSGVLFVGVVVWGGFDVISVMVLDVVGVLCVVLGVVVVGREVVIVASVVVVFWEVVVTGVEKVLFESTMVVVGLFVVDVVVLRVVVLVIGVITGVVKTLLETRIVDVGVVNSINASIFLSISLSCLGLVVAVGSVTDSGGLGSGSLRKHFSMFSWL